MAKSVFPVATISFTKEQLWELMNNFDASFSESGENELATLVSAKLHRAYERLLERVPD
jgi:hypothetical protein